MFGSILIFSGNKETRQKISQEILDKLDLNKKINPDLIILEPEKDKKSIGIKETKNCLKWLSEKPFSSDFKAIVIPQAEKMTLDAQNSILKALEEPPTYASIILLAKNLNDVIPTIISRCQKIDASNQKTTHYNNLIADKNTQVSTDISLNSILQMSIIERLERFGEINKQEKELTVEMLERWLYQIHNQVASANNQAKLVEAYQVIKEVKETLEKSNASQKFALDYLAVNIS